MSTPKRPTGAEHLERHRQLHGELDELSADFMIHTGRLLSEATALELYQWSRQQATDPTEEGEAFRGESPHSVRRRKEDGAGGEKN